MPENQTVWKSDNEELKKKHSFILVGGVEMGIWGGLERTAPQRMAGGQLVPPLRVDKVGGATGE